MPSISDVYVVGMLEEVALLEVDLDITGVLETRVVEPETDLYLWFFDATEPLTPPPTAAPTTMTASTPRSSQKTQGRSPHMRRLLFTAPLSS